jgi:hypothetical protein
MKHFVILFISLLLIQCATVSKGEDGKPGEYGKPATTQQKGKEGAKGKDGENKTKTIGIKL